MSVRDVVCRKSFIAQTSDHQFEHGSHSYGFVFSLADAEFTSFQSIYTLIVGAVCVFAFDIEHLSCSKRRI